MNQMRIVAIGVVLAVLAGCVTTEQAQKAMDSRFIGQTSDAFFAQYGAPQSSFGLNNGGTTYRWKGGETVINIPAQYKKVEPSSPGVGTSNTKTTTNVSRPDANTTVTETSSTTFSMNVSAPAQQVLVSPARTVQVFCEAQISVDSKGIITNIQVTQDTQGAGLSISRCAEVFNVKS